jgi:hypothetical protein
MIKFKAFIYRLSAVFGLSIYLAKKEEDAYIKTLDNNSELHDSISVGLWQVDNGFTTVWTYKKPFLKAMVLNLKHVVRK